MSERAASCNGCGLCCRLGGRCDIRSWTGRTPGFIGRCENLADNDDGTTYCLMLEGEPDEVLALAVDGLCDFPVLRQDIG